MSSWFVIPAGVLAAAAVGVWLLRLRFALVQVRGTSMLPALRPGDQLLVRRGRRGTLRTGMVVVVRPPMVTRPRRPWPLAPRLGAGYWIIKRIAALPGDPVPGSMRAAARGAATVPAGMLLVSADNPAGTDSRHWGFVPAGHVLGPVVRNAVVRNADVRNADAPLG